MSDGLIADRYELGGRLGFGGMSTVHLAFDRRLERQVAVKLLAEHLADDPQFVSRFRREALSAARLVHPNIVQVFDFGLESESHRHFIVMEYIQGQSGAEMLRDQDRLELSEALAMLNHACRGLEHAHRHGVVHRDVKPGNLLRSDDGLTKLADFGIAKASDTSSKITQVGSVIGTAAYLAPEQASGQEATARSDLYALGVVTYQLLAGRLPYEAQSLTELALKQQRERPPALDEVQAGVPHGIAQAVARALELDPADRFASADEMREALSAGAAGQTFPEPEPTAATAFIEHGLEPTSATRMATAATAQPDAPPRPRRLSPTPGPHTPPPAPAPAYAEGVPARRRERPAPRRRSPALTFVVLLLLAVVVVALVLAVAYDGQQVSLSDVTQDTFDGSVDAMRDLIESNTR